MTIQSYISRGLTERRGEALAFFYEASTVPFLLQ